MTALHDAAQVYRQVGDGAQQADAHHLTYGHGHKPAQPCLTREHAPCDSAAVGIYLHEAPGARPRPGTRIHPGRTESQPPQQLGAPTRGRALPGTVTTTRLGSVTVAL